MLTRRKFLKLGAAAGASVLVPWTVDTQRAFPGVKFSRAFAQAPLPAIIDPLYVNPIADPAAIPQFASSLPVVKALGLRKDVTAGGTVTVTMAPTTQDLLGVGLNTPVWGYGVNGGPVTYPGATFVAMKDKHLNVQWVNNLPNAHLLPVDDTLHWAYGKVQGSFAANGMPAVPHLHGGHTDSDYDGLPEQWWSSGGSGGVKYGDTWVTDQYVYDNSQEAATLWYHDHVLGITRLNVYAGLAGFYFLRDDNEMHLINNNLIPSGDFEIEMVIQDRMFYPDGSLAYPDAAWIAPGGNSIAPSHQPEFFGQVILVNGKAWPFLNVEPRQYRFRLLNGSDSRFYNLRITGGNLDTGPAFWVIGNDTGLLNAPVPMNQLTIGPGERYDVVVDFRGFEGQPLIVSNNARSPFPKGVTVNPKLDGRIMAFNVGLTTSGGVLAPLTPTTNLRPQANPVPVPNVVGAPVRKLMLFEATDQYGRLQPLLGTIDPNPPAGAPMDGTFLWDDGITEDPALGSTEVWEVHNATVDAHPIHLHLVAFQIINRQKYKATVVPKLNDHGTQGGALRNVTYKGQPKGPGAYEAGYKDTAIMYPNEVTRVIATFDKPGRYVWHCHILSHEDHEMMRPYHVGPMP